MKVNPLVAEFFGTLTLIFIGVGAIAGNHLNNGQTGLVGIALAHGLAIAVMVTATAATSGGHLNPAVTAGLWAAKKIEPLNAVAYIIAQCLGAIAGAFLIKLCVPAAALAAVQMGTPALGKAVSPGMGLITE